MSAGLRTAHRGDTMFVKCQRGLCSIVPIAILARGLQPCWLGDYLTCDKGGREQVTPTCGFMVGVIFSHARAWMLTAPSAPQ